MNRSTWPLLCLVLVAGGAAQARPSDEDGSEPRGGRRSEERGAPGPRAPSPSPAAPEPPSRRLAVPAPPAPPGLPVPRFGVPPAGAAGGERPADRPSDPARGHWSTQGIGERRDDDARRREERRDEGWRNDGRRVDPRDNDWRRNADPRWQQRDDWQRNRMAEPPRRSYQWRDYDRWRAQNFRFDGGRYYGRSRYRVGAYLWPRGYGMRLWLVGEWLPSAFFLDSRYALDYWRFGLYRPPVGCRWVRVSNDALLVDNFNGEVLDAVYDLFW